MDCTEKRVDMRKHNPDSAKELRRISPLLFKLNHTMPMTEEYANVLKELFCDNIGENSYVAAPLNGARLRI